MIGKSLAISAFLLTCLCGCIPDPHRTQLIPALSGVVTRSGQPVSGTEINVRYRYGSDYTVSIGTTDSQGRFTYPGKKKFHLFVFIGDPGFDWDLTIRHQDKDILGFADHGLGFVPEQASFVCNLDATTEQACIQQ